MSKLLTVLCVLCCAPVLCLAQWAPVTAVGVSGGTKWDAVSQDANGDLYFSGWSDKLGGNPNKAYVTAKYSEGVAKWSTKLATASSLNGQTSNGVDAAGNSYMIGFFQNAPIKLPDGSQISYTTKCYFVAKYDATGKLAWAKKLFIPSYDRFQVMPDGTIGIVAKDINRFFLFGDDSITVGGNYLLEIATDGTLTKSVSIDEASLTPNYVEWKEPGKVFMVNVTSTGVGLPTLYQRGIFDLASKSFAPEGTPLSVTGPPNTFAWNAGGIPYLYTTIWDRPSGHLFALMSSFTGDVYLNLTDTIRAQTNTQIRDGYVVELDEQMHVVRKIHLTNPVQLAVRDAQVVVTAIVRGTADFGFVTPDTTIRITRKQYLMDSYALYVMDRQFKYQRHGLVEPEFQTFLTPNATFIGPTGDVYISLDASGTLFFQGQAPFSSHSGTVLAKLSGSSSAVRESEPLMDLRVYPNPVTAQLSIEQPGAFAFTVVDMLGRAIANGTATDRATCDLKNLPDGHYLIHLTDGKRTQSKMIEKRR